jgi:hypothetical protein
LSSNFNLCDLNICFVVVGFFLNLHGCLFTRNRIGGVMVSVLSSNAVDRGFIGGVMVSVLSSNVVDRGFKAPDQTKDYKIDICCFSAKHAALRRKS